MHFLSVSILGLLALSPVLAAPSETSSSGLEARAEYDSSWMSKRCCILCDGPAYCGNQDEKREAFDTMEEAITGIAKREAHDVDDASWVDKRCCILCDGPNYCLGGGSNDKREVFVTKEEAISGVAKKKARDEHDFRGISKRCCILCDNPYSKCSAENETREVVETEGEAIFGTEKRCCINCMNPCANCSGKGPGGITCGQKKARREEISQWPAKRCCINCDNPYARCGATDKREAVDTLEDALFVTF